MTLFLAEIRHTVENWYYDTRYVRYMAFGLLGLLIAGGVYGGYAYWRSSLNQRATVALSESMNEYVVALNASSRTDVPAHEITNLFENVARDMELGYIKYGYSSLAPFFLAYQAQALSHLGKEAEAYEISKKVYRSFAASSPFYLIFGIQTAHRAFALEGHQDEGVKILQEIGSSSNSSREDATYNLALHYLRQGDKAKAKELLQQVVDTVKKLDQQAPSINDQLAAHLLETLI